jgi:hypothetical protein
VALKQVVRSPLTIIIASLLHSHLSQSPELCGSPHQAAHYHILGPQVKAFIPVTRHLAGQRVRESYYYYLPTTSNFFYWRYSPLWVLASSVGSGGFVIVSFSWVGLLAPGPTPNLKDQGLHFVWPLLFGLSGMGAATRSLRSGQYTRSSPGHWGTQTSSPR